MSNATYTGYSIGLGVDAPVANGKAMFSAGYIDAEQSDANEDLGHQYDFTRWVVSAGYDYPLSKRTNVYGILTYAQDSLEYTTTATPDQDPTVFAAMVGLRHKF